MFIGRLAKWLTRKTRTVKRLQAPSRRNKCRKRLELEPLEDRRLLTASIMEFGPTLGTNAEITAGPDGAFWFTEPGAFQTSPPAIGRIDTTGKITEFTNGLQQFSNPLGIAAGSDGNIWFTDPNEGKIGQFNISNDTITEFPVGTTTFLQGTPELITAGPDGALWFTEQVSDPNAFIGRITTNGTVTNEFPLPNLSSSPFGIATGPDGNLWFTDSGTNSIGRITPAGTITEFPIPTANANPSHITAASDGALWFTEQGANKIGRITVTGSITELPISATGSPVGITAGPDNDVSFTEQIFGTASPSDVIGRISLTAGNAMTFSTVPTTSAFPQGIVAGTGDTLWFAESGQHQIGRETINGPVATGTSLTEVQTNSCTDVVATFTDADTGEAASNFSVTINWGDGTPPDTTTPVVTQTATSPTGNSFSVSGTHAFAQPGTFTVTVTIHDKADFIDGVATSTATVISANDAFVRGLYRDVLLRLPDPAGLAFWVSNLDAGLMSRAQVANGFIISAERRGLEVDEDYQVFLGRAADPAGRAFFTSQLLAGFGNETVILEIILSPEYTQTHDNLAFVENLFNGVFGRAGSPSEVAAWVGALDGGSMDRGGVLELFLSSPEIYGLAISQNYETFLRRGPDPAGLAFFNAGILNGTITPDGLTIIILASQEYLSLNIANC
jgi:virginiamycin B lyase